MLARGRSVTVEYEVMDTGLEVVLLLPALGADSSIWDQEIDVLSPLYTLVPCETGGHRGNAAASLEERADGVIAVLDALAVERAHVVGISMGGMLAQILAARVPQRVRSMTLISTAPTYDRERRQQLLDRADLVEREGMAPIAGPTAERWLSRSFRETHQGAVEAVREMLLRADPNAYAGAARAVASVDTLSLLPAIRAPSVIVDGQDDSSLAPDAAELLATNLPGAQTRVIPRSAHLCCVDAPEETLAILRRFLGDHRSEDPDMDRLTPSRVW